MKLAKCSPGILEPKAWERYGGLVESVAGRYGVTVDELLGRGRTQRVALARRELYLRLHESGFAYSEIGRMLGRDHTSVRAGVRKELG